MTSDENQLFELTKTDLVEFTKMSDFYKKLSFFGIMSSFVVFFLASLLFINTLIGSSYLSSLQYFSSIPYFMYAMVIAISGLYFLASVKLNRLGYDLEKAIKTDNQESFDSAIEDLSKYYERFGLILIAISIMIIIIIIKSLNNPAREYYQSF